jgi:hypothetical protein
MTTPRSWAVVTEPDSVTGKLRVRIAPAFHNGAGLTLATPCATETEAHSFARCVDRFFECMIDDLKDCAAEQRGSGGSPWTRVYLDKGFYVRLVPTHMDTEAAGYPHGLAIAGHFTTKGEAASHAQTIDAEMTGMLMSLQSTVAPGDPLMNTIGILTGNAGSGPTTSRR